MTIRTGKSGRYRYYVCAGCAQKGPTVCPGRSIGMAALDGMVLKYFTDRLIQPARLRRRPKLIESGGTTITLAGTQSGGAQFEQ